jgi:hypothetical protein
MTGGFLVEMQKEFGENVLPRKAAETELLAEAGL